MTPVPRTTLPLLVLALLAAVAGCSSPSSGSGPETSSPDASADVPVTGDDTTATLDTLDDGTTTDDTTLDGGDATADGEVTAPPSPWTLQPLVEPGALETLVSLDDGWIFAAGEGGLVLRYTGSQWVPVGTFGDGTLHGGTVFSGAAVLVGDGGLVLQGGPDGFASLPSGTTEDLYGAAGSPESEEYLFVVGTSGTILTREDGAFVESGSNSSLDLTGVWARSPAAAFAVGQMGMLLHLEGGSWVSSQVAAPSSRLEAIAGFEPSPLFAVGTEGTIVKYDGSLWKAQLSNDLQARALHGLLAVDADSFVAVGAGGVILELSGGKWSTVDVAGPYFKTSDLAAVAPTPQGMVAVGAAGVSLDQADGEWRDLPTSPTERITAAVPLGDVLVVGGLGGLLVTLTSDGVVTEVPTGYTALDVQALAPLPDGGLLVAGSTAELPSLVLRLDPCDSGLCHATGGAPYIPSAPLGALTSTLAVGEGGLVLRRTCTGTACGAEASSWEEVEAPLVATDLEAIIPLDGADLVVGAHGIAAVVDGDDVTLEALPTSGGITAGCTRGDTVVLVGDNGVVIEGSLGSWDKVHEAPGTFSYAVTCREESAWAVGWAGTILAYDETGWHEEASPTKQSLQVAVETPWDQLMAMGDGATVIVRGDEGDAP